MDQNLNQQQNSPPAGGQTPQAPNPVGAGMPPSPTPQPTNPITPPIQPPPPPAGPASPSLGGQSPLGGTQVTDSSKGSNKAVLFGGLGVVMLAIIGGIYFLAVQYSQKTAQVPEITPIPRLSPSPTPPLVEATEADIDKIDIGDPENDLKSLDQDVKQL